METYQKAQPCKRCGTNEYNVKTKCCVLCKRTYIREYNRQWMRDYRRNGERKRDAVKIDTAAHDIGSRLLAMRW